MSVHIVVAVEQKHMEHEKYVQDYKGYMDTDEKGIWVEDFRVEELYFDSSDGDLEGSFVSGEDVYMSFSIPIEIWLTAIRKMHNPEKLQEFAASFFARRIG